MKNLTTDSSYLELANELRELSNQIDIASKQLSNLKQAKEAITDGILPEKMRAEGMQTINLKGIGRLSVRDEVRVSAIGAKKLELQAWFEDNGHEALIGRTINSSALKAFILECIREGEDYPDELINMYSFERVTLTKV